MRATSAASTVLAELEAFGPVGRRARQRRRRTSCGRRCPRRTVIAADGARIGMVHDAGPRRRAHRAAAPRFPAPTPWSSATRTSRCTSGRPTGFQIFNPGSPTERRRAPRHTMGMAACAAGGRIRARSTWPDTLDRAMDLVVFFAGTAGSVPTARRGLPAILRAPRRGPDPVRLRRGDPAPARRSVGPGRPDRDLHHPLPRRPLARPARHAQDVRPARARAAADHLRARRACASCMGLALRVAGAVRLRAGARRARARRRAASATAIAIAAVRRRAPRRRPSATRCTRTSAPARSTPSGAARLGVAPGPGLRPPAARRDRQRRDARAGARARRGPGRKLVHLRRHRARARRCAIAAHEADLLVHEATFAEEERDRAAETGHSTAEQAADDRPRGRGRLLALDAPLHALRRPRAARGGAGDLPQHRRPARLRHRSRSRSPSAASRGSSAGASRGAPSTGGAGAVRAVAAAILETRG